MHNGYFSFLKERLSSLGRKKSVWYKMSTSRQANPLQQGSCSQSSSAVSNSSKEEIKDEEYLVQRLQTLYNSELFSDIVLRVGEHRFHAHKFLLITSSEVFEAMLSEDRWREANQPEVTLTEDEECIPVFGPFLKYIYCGTVSLTTNTVLPILLLADKYCIRRLCESCIQYMLRHIVESPDTNRTLSWYQYAKMTGSKELQENCLRFIVSNFHIVQNSPDWLELSLQEMKEFLGRSDIIVQSEYTLWEKVEKWILHDSNYVYVEENLSNLLPLVRFSLMTPKQLHSVENSRLFKEHKDVFGERVWQAYRRHSLMTENIPAPEDNEDLRNFLDTDYKIAYDLYLANYQQKNKIESKIFIDNITVPLKYTPSSINTTQKLTKFQIELYPKGYFLPHMLYGNYMGKQNDNTTLIVRRYADKCRKISVEMAVIVYGMKNHVKYIAHMASFSYKFDRHSTRWEIPIVMPIEKLKEEKSFFLVKGNFEGKLFLKVKSFEVDEES